MSWWREWIADRAVRHGVKLGIAGTAAVGIALAARLEQPVWALFTVFVLMMAQHVGATAEKAFLWLIGTLIGGVSGYLIVGSLEQSPVLFVGSMAVFVGFCTAMFGQPHFPYAFLLSGMTALVVASNGMSNPGNAWQLMLWRIEEVSLGILVVLVVQSSIWPRYAHREFLALLREAFGDLSGCFRRACADLDRGVEPEGARRALGFPARIVGLRSLLEFGTRESKYFRALLPECFRTTGCLARIASAISTLREPLPRESPYRERLGAAWEAVRHALESWLDCLASADRSPEDARACGKTAAKAWARLEESLLASRKLSPLPPPDEARILASHLLATDEIRRQLELATELVEAIGRGRPRGGDPQRKNTPLLPPPAWIWTGIRSAVVVACALFIQNWLQPPGAQTFTLAAWLYVGMIPLAPNGVGDHRAIRQAVLAIGLSALLALGLLLASPMLSSYAAFNTILFASLFLWGYLSAETRGMSFGMQFGLFAVANLLALNAQRPVEFHQIVGTFFGLALSLVLSSLIRRTIGPVLPQFGIRDRFLEWAGICREVLRNGWQAVPFWRLTRLALLPGEISTRIDLLPPPAWSEEIRQTLRAAVEHMTNLSGNLALTSTRLPPGGEAAAAEARQEIEAGMTRIAGLLEGNAAGDAPHARAAAALQSWCAGERLAMVARDESPANMMRVLGTVERYLEALGDAARAAAAFAMLRPGALSEDPSL